jgi:hypothetical protein
MEFKEKTLRLIIEQAQGGNPLFKTNYDPETKKLSASYYLIDETDKFWEVINIIEREQKNIEWADGAKSYKFLYKRIRLPKSQVLNKGEIENTGYHIFEIPYWLFSKQSDLEVKRIEGNKRFANTSQEIFERGLPLSDIEMAMKPLGGDLEKLEKVKNNVELLKNPKPIERPEVMGKASTFNITKKSGPEHLQEDRQKLASQYDESDFVEPVYLLFRKWLQDENIQFKKGTPFSTLWKTYVNDFRGYYGLEPVRLHYQTPRLFNTGKELFLNGVIDLESLISDEKITEKYSKQLDWFLSNLPQIDGVTYQILEPSEHTLFFDVSIDLPKIVKSDEIVDVDNFFNNFRDFLKNYLNIQQGSIVEGDYRMHKNTNVLGNDVFLKEINKIIKPFIRKVVKEEAKRDISKIVVDWKGEIPTIKVYLNYLKPTGSLQRGEAEALVKERLSNMGYGKNLTYNVKFV